MAEIRAESMSKTTGLEQGSQFMQATAVLSPDIDWRHLAGQRLARLVDLEHDCAVMRERLDALRTEHDMLMVLTEERLRQQHKLKVIGERREGVLDDLMRRHAQMENSHSWRITAPLRALFRRGARGRHLLTRVLLAVLRSSRLGPMAARLAPALHARVRSRLSSRLAVH